MWPQLAAGQDVGESLRELSSSFAAAGIDSPESDARLLLSAALGLSLGELAHARMLGRRLTEDDAARLDSMAARRIERIPLQHITGSAPFRYLELQVGPGCLIPRPETELLVDLALAHIDAHPRKAEGLDVLDLGTGSGAIAAAIATERPGTRVTAVDISPEALGWAAKNTLGTGVRLIKADGTQPREEFEGAFDVVISNPPYVPEAERPTQPEALADPELALYGGSPDGLAIPEAMIRQSARWLAPGGLLAMEHAESQGAALRDVMSQAGLTETRTLTDLTGRERMSTGLRPSDERMAP